MSGLYLHIPFCKQACHYCNFHFSTSLKYRTEMVEALQTELRLRRDYLPAPHLESVYFGGGTPSLLDASELNALFTTIRECFLLREGAEITLEANPDDLTPDKLAMLADSPVNRLSIGIQSFSDADLQYMNRAHNAREAARCLDLALEAGFTNLTVDLIYGLPTLSDRQWADNMQQVIGRGIPHLSCYALTVEERTVLHHFVRTGKAPGPEEEAGARQFEQLMDTTAAAGYEHYEISNFALPGMQAVHNSNYWRGVPYLGVGPSAHSYDGSSRQWNVAHNMRYIKGLQRPGSQFPKELFEKEDLSPRQQYNEYVMTGLRTSWGCRLEAIDPAYRPHFLTQIAPHLDHRSVETDGQTYRLTRTGKLLADAIAVDLFL